MTTAYVVESLVVVWSDNVLFRAHARPSTLVVRASMFRVSTVEKILFVESTSLRF